MEACCPPPKMENPLKELGKKIKQARSLMEEGVRAEELGEAVGGMETEYCRIQMEQEREGLEAWKVCWGNWGVAKGQRWAWEV